MSGGFPRIALTGSQQAIADRFTELLTEATVTPYPELEARAHRASSRRWASALRRWGAAGS